MNTFNETMLIPMSAINKFFYFIYNYESPRKVVRDIWGPDEYLCLHLQERLDSYIETYGRMEAMLQLYASLDNPNRRLLLAYILDTYNGECSLFSDII